MELFTGGSGSGKSELAEKAAYAAGGRRAYFATMRVCDAESKARAEKHRGRRACLQFETVECPLGLPNGRGYDTVLVECLSNLTANILYEKGIGAKKTAEDILAQLTVLHRNVPHVLAVTNEVFSDAVQYGSSMRQYLEVLGAVNRGAARLADAVIESVCGIPVYWKGAGRKQDDPGEKGGEEKMVMVTGGSNQGKLDFVLEKFQLRQTDVAQGISCPYRDIRVKPVVNHLHRLVERMLREGKEPEAEIMQAVEQNPGVIILCDELGCGLVPVDRQQRELRERVGRLQCNLAQKAVAVYRVCCGIPLQIKGSQKDSIIQNLDNGARP